MLHLKREKNKNSALSRGAVKELPEYDSGLTDEEG
jgi:hypothetical protein